MSFDQLIPNRVREFEAEQARQEAERQRVLDEAKRRTANNPAAVAFSQIRMSDEAIARAGFKPEPQDASDVAAQREVRQMQSEAGEALIRQQSRR